MADTINIEGMNEQMARTDSLVAKLAQDVDKLSTSFSNLSKSANVEKMLGTINNAFKTMGGEITNTSNNVKQGVSSIIDDITKLVQTAGKTRGGIGKGVKLDFVEGTNITEHQELFNAAILKTAENYETLRGKVTQLKKDLLALYADTPESERMGKDYLNKRKEITQEIALLEKEMTKNKDAYLAVLRKDLEVENLIKQANDKEKKGAQELKALYSEMINLRMKSDTIWSNARIRNASGKLPITKENAELLKLYGQRIDEISSKISTLSQKYPELAKHIDETFEAQYLEQNIKSRVREAAAIDKVTAAQKKREEQEANAASKKKIQEENNEIKELTRLYKELESVSKKRESKRSGFNAFSEEDVKVLNAYKLKIEELKEKIEKLAIKYPELAEKMRGAFDISMLEHSIELRRKENAEIERAQRSTTQGALDFSAGVKTANQAKEAIQYLTAARNNLDRTDAKYEENLKRLNEAIRQNRQFIEEVTGASSRLQTRTFSLLQSTKQLAEGFGIMFSVYGISNFIRKLVQVTGEFELQQTALSSIIDSADKAQTMFGELQKMAVASPYSIQQLVSYNKQLAAYRVETDKLLPVLKQLGDVASGVGVDMQRLILAYGQVKAANYLRGQELRQFSEAGINILGELARRFSDAEGKVVSTGEVFDRVSKRLVKFEDVAAVFDDLTKKGGIFYDMQAKQAETVRGQLMNLKDAFQIALYKIGQETNGSIRTFLRLLRFVASHLTTIAKIGSAALVTFVTWKTILSAIELKTKLMAKDFDGMAKSFPKITSLLNAVKGNPIAAAAAVAVTGITAFVVQLVKARKRIAELRKESIETFSSMTESMKEFQDAMAKSGDYQLGVDQSGAKKYKLIKTDNLKNDLRIVKDFIEDLEKQGIELKPGFDLEYSEQDKDKLAEKLAGFMDDVQTMAADLIAAQKGGKEIVAKFADPLEQEIKRFSESLDKFKEQIRVSSQGIEDEFVAEGRRIGIQDSEINKAVENIKKLRTGQYESLSEAREMWSVIEKLQDSITKKTGKRLAYEKESLKISKMFSAMFAKYNRGSLSINRNFEQLFSQFAEFKGVSPEGLVKLFADVNEKEAKDAMNQFLQYTNGAFQESGKQFTDDIWNQLLLWLKENQKANPFVIDVLMKKPSASMLADNRLAWQREYNDFVKPLNEKLAKYMKDYGYHVDLIDVAESDVTRLKQAADLEKSIKENEEQIAALKGSKTSKDAQEDDIEGLELLIKYQKEAKKWLKGQDKSSTKAAKDRSSEFEKMVKFIRQLRSEYEKLNKTFPIEDAAKRVADSFRDEFEAMPKFFQDVFGGDISNIAFMSPEQVVESLNKIRPIIENNFKTWQKKLQIYFEKNKAEEQVEIDVEFKKKTADEINRQIEELFSNYEIQLQLTELGLTSEDAKNIFNLDAIDLASLGKKLSELGEEIEQKFGTEELNKFKEYQKKYTEIYEKAQLDRMKKYSAYLQKEMSERIKVEMETLKQIAELNSIPALYSEDEDSLQYKTRQRIYDKIMEERSKKIDALIWKEFQQSDMYVSLFTDLGNASGQSLRFMKERLEDLRGSLKSLSATDLKAVSDNLRQIDEQLLQDNPFDALIVASKDFKEMKDELQKDETLKKILGVDELGNFRKSIKTAMNEINKELYGYTEIQADGTEKRIKGLEEELIMMEKLYQAAKMRDTAAAEMRKLDFGFGEDWFDANATLRTAKKNVKLKSEQIALETDEKEIERLKNEQIELQNIVDLLEVYIKAMNTLDKKSGESTEKLGEEYDALKEKIENIKKEFGKLSDAQALLVLKFRAAAQSLRATGEAVSKIQSLYETWMENIDYLGGATDDLTEAQTKLGSAIFKSLTQVLDLTSRIMDAIPKITEGFTAAGISINSAMGIIGLIAEALQLCITLATAIGQFKDDQITASIKQVQLKVDSLTRSYEDLSDAFDSAFNQEKLRAFNREMKYNLELQRDYLQQELDLEKDKKKKDWDAINALETKLHDIDKQVAELSSKFYEELGGFGSDSAYKDAATQFVDAWYNAFMETGSGLSGLEDTFDDFFVKMLKKQLMQKVADHYFKDLLEEFDELLNRGDIWENDYFWNNYMNDLPDRLAEANEVLTEYFQRWQGIFGAGGIGGLDNFQQGIQGVTEQTADILATYLNSIRLYVAQDNQNMTALINWLGVGTTNDSLMSNIRLTAQNTSAIHTLLQSLVPGQAHPLGGTGLKVFVA